MVIDKSCWVDCDDPDYRKKAVKKREALK